MCARRLVVSSLLFAAALTLMASAPPPAADAQVKGKGKAAPPPPAPKPKFTAFRVQVRHPAWRHTRVANAAVARNLAVNLRLAGWTTVQIRQNRSGAIFVRAKMPRWQNRALLTNRHLAETLAAQGRLQGFQARIVPVHH